MIVILSVPHTGNRALFEALGGRVARHEWGRDPRERRCDHVYRHFGADPDPDLLDLVSISDTVMVPIRDPRRVAISYWRRGEEDLPDMLTAWDQMVRLHREIDPVWWISERCRGRRRSELDPYPEIELYDDNCHQELAERIGPLYDVAERLVESCPVASAIYGADACDLLS